MSNKTIHLITRTDKGALKFCTKYNCETPQEAVDNYDGQNTPIAWTYDSPSGRVREALQDAEAKGQLIDEHGLVFEGPFLKSVDGLMKGVGQVLAKPEPQAAPAPSLSKADLAMIQRDGPARKPKLAAPLDPVSTAKPFPFGTGFCSPDMVLQSHQLGARAA